VAARASFTQKLNGSVYNRQMCYLRLKPLPRQPCSDTASQVGGEAAADAEQLRQQLAEAQAQLQAARAEAATLQQQLAEAQAATAEAATLQQQLDAERTAAAGMRRQLEAGEAERTATRKAAARQCATAEAAQQRAEADARAARAELAAGKAEVRLDEQGLGFSTRQVLEYLVRNVYFAESQPVFC
jgi:chromosome segregation ATPase